MMVLATSLQIEEIRKEVLSWHQANEYMGYNHLLPIMEWELNKTGFTMYESKVK